MCACHPCTGAMLTFAVSLQCQRMTPEGNPTRPYETEIYTSTDQHILAASSSKLVYCILDNWCTWINLSRGVRDPRTRRRAPSLGPIGLPLFSTEAGRPLRKRRALQALRGWAAQRPRRWPGDGNSNRLLGIVCLFVICLGACAETGKRRKQSSGRYSRV